MTRRRFRAAQRSAIRRTTWYVYILQCADRSFYIGSTTDLQRRLQEHRTTRGGAYTRSRLPIRLRHQETYPDRTTAQRREAQLKRWTHAEKLALTYVGQRRRVQPVRPVPQLAAENS